MSFRKKGSRQGPLLSERAQLGRPMEEREVEEEKEEEEEEREEAGRPQLPKTLFPLDSLLPEVLKQEELLWQHNQPVLQALRAGTENNHADSPSLRRRANSASSSHSSTPPNPPSTSSPLTTQEDAQEDNKRLFLVRYGRLIDTVHSYFRRLEKQHACLYLTGRKAKHESLRHVEVNSSRSEDISLEVLSAGALANSAGRQLTILKDEELLVYRCALMCAQFPMLSAPSPPPGHSPTPPMIGTRFSDLGSVDLARTAPADSYLSKMDAPPGGHSGRGPKSVPEQAGGLKGSRRTHSGEAKAEKSPRQPSSGTGAHRDAPAEQNTGSPNAKHKQLTSEVPVAETQSLVPNMGTRQQQHASEPILIKAATKGRGKGGGSHRGTAQGRRKVASESTSVSTVAESGEEEEVAELMSGKRPRVGSYSLVREQPFTPMVNREMLCGLVRRAFRQTEDQQLQFDQILRHEYGRRSKGEILAKELAAQLQVLENNAHPFYKPKHFVARNGYDQWLQSEKQRVRGLIDKFWHFSLPRPQLWRHYNPTDYHRAFNVLLQKIIGCESLTQRREPVHTGRTPSKPLSPTAQRLLLEFGLRYGVGELYRKIVYLDYLAKHFDYEIWYICHCTEELRGIRGLLPRHRNRVTAVRREMDMLRSTVHLLHGQADNSLTRIDRLFNDSDPGEGVACLIELLTEVLDAEQTLFGKKVRPAEDWLKRYLKSGFVLRYERRKEIAADETVHSRTAQPFVITPVLVNALLLSVRDEVQDYKDKFQSVSDRKSPPLPYFDIVPFAKLEFYRLLCADACSLCLRVIHRPESRQTLSHEMVGLMYRMNERDIEWESVISSDMQLWRRNFSDLALVWMDVLGKELNSWITESISKDQWTLFSFTMEYPSRGSGILSSRPSSITAGVRPSPFPSPAFTPGPRDVPFMPSSLGSSRGAFMPYNKALLKSHPKKAESPLASESSGAISDISSARASSVDSIVSDPLISEAALFSRATGTENAPSGFSPLTFREDMIPPSLRSEKEHGKSVNRDIIGETKREEEMRADQEVTFVFSPTASVGTAIQEDGVLESIVEQDEEKGQQDRRSEQDERGEQDERSEQDKEQDERNSVEQHMEPDSSHNEPNASKHDSSISGPLDVVVRVVHPKMMPPEGAKMTPPRGAKMMPTGSPRERDLDWEGFTTAHLTPPASTAAGSLGSVVRFGNLLDGCAAPGVGIVRPRASGTSTVVGFDSRSEDIASLPSQTTPPILEIESDPHHKPPHTNPPPQQNGPPQEFQTPRDTPNSDFPQEQRRPVRRREYLFPVSNSPIDIITMLIRVGSFAGNVLQILSPKLRQSAVGPGDNKEYGSEVATARQQASQQWRFVEEMRSEMLKKLHKGMVNCLKLYADNLLHMDICGWSSEEAMDLIGEQMVHHLKRRKDAQEVWGCRHMVEAKYGLHPHGLPCEKRNSQTFESVTRDMCIRINNVHALISIFPSLEFHILASTKTETQKAISAFGYISSEPQSPLPRQRATQQSDSGSWRNSLSPPLEREQEVGDRRPEAGFRSRESLRLLDYLRTIQTFQLKLLCHRMDKFFKPALTLLLELKLGECSVEKRLHPLVTFLSRHRTSLRKYIYPECFGTVMRLMWEHIVKDLEGETVKLRASKRPVTSRAHLILQTLSHLIKFMHDNGKGLPLDFLTSSSEYLQALLDIMTRSTEHLVTIFNKLATPQFLQSRLDLSRAPVTVDEVVLYALRAQLHTYKKCFSGKEFVDTIIEIGQQFQSNGRPASMTNIYATQQRGGGGEGGGGGGRGRSFIAETSPSHIISPTGQPIMYTVHYAKEVAQYLLNEGILLPLGEASPSENPSSLDASAGLDERPDLESSLDNVSLTRSQLSGSRLSNPHTPTFTRDSFEPSMAVVFHYSSQVFYRFASVEDVHSSALYQSQVLSARGTSEGKTGAEAINLARCGTLYLVFDLLAQRARKERRAKQFLQSPNAANISEHKRLHMIDANQIFKM